MLYITFLLKNTKLPKSQFCPKKEWLLCQTKNNYTYNWYFVEKNILLYITHFGNNFQDNVLFPEKLGENDLNMSLIKNIKDFLTYSKNPTNFENPKKFSRNFKGKMEIVFFTSLSIPKN